MELWHSAFERKAFIFFPFTKAGLYLFLPRKDLGFGLSLETRRALLLCSKAQGVQLGSFISPIAGLQCENKTG